MATLAWPRCAGSQFLPVKRGRDSEPRASAHQGRSGLPHAKGSQGLGGLDILAALQPYEPHAACAQMCSSLSRIPSGHM